MTSGVAFWIGLLPFEKETQEVLDFHDFLLSTFEEHKFVTVQKAWQELPQGEHAIFLAVAREALSEFLPWIQLHRPLFLSLAFLPAQSSEVSKSTSAILSKTALWLGTQWDMSGWNLEKSLNHGLNIQFQGSASDIPASKGWGQEIFEVSGELASLRNVAAKQLFHFHAHVFVDSKDPSGNLKEWYSFYDRIGEAFPMHKYIIQGSLDEGPVGPHPIGQFEIIFFRPAIPDFVEWLQFHRPDKFSILLHPMLYSCKGDELYGEYFDHGRRAFWLGAEVPGLNLDFLASIDEMVRAGVRRPYELFDWQNPRGTAMV